MSMIPTSSLDFSRLQQELVDTPDTEWQHLQVVAETGSTNTDLCQLAATDRQVDRLLLLAEYQTAGRGRYTRSFEAPTHSSVTFSALIRVGSVVPSRWPLLALALGIAVIDGLRTVTTKAVEHTSHEAPPLALKWPNDVLCNGQKLSGMLVEMAAVDARYEDGTSAAAIIPGVGINITQDPTELPVDYAISLAMAMGEHTPSREDCAIAVLTELDRRVGQWRRGEGRIVEDYVDRCATIGQEIDVQLPEGKLLSGTAVDIADDGCLLVRPKVGNIVAVRAGDVRHVWGGGCYLP